MEHNHVHGDAAQRIDESDPDAHPDNERIAEVPQSTGHGAYHADSHECVAHQVDVDQPDDQHASVNLDQHHVHLHHSEVHNRPAHVTEGPMDEHHEDANHVDVHHVDARHVDNHHVDHHHVDAHHVNGHHVDAHHVDAHHVDPENVAEADVDAQHMDVQHIDAHLAEVQHTELHHGEPESNVAHDTIKHEDTCLRHTDAYHYAQSDPDNDRALRLREVHHSAEHESGAGDTQGEQVRVIHSIVVGVSGDLPHGTAPRSIVAPQQDPPHRTQTCSVVDVQEDVRQAASHGDHRIQCEPSEGHGRAAIVSSMPGGVHVDTSEPVLAKVGRKLASDEVAPRHVEPERAQIVQAPQPTHRDARSSPETPVFSQIALCAEDCKKKPGKRFSQSPTTDENVKDCEMEKAGGFIVLSPAQKDGALAEVGTPVISRTGRTPPAEESGQGTPLPDTQKGTQRGEVAPSVNKSSSGSAPSSDGGRARAERYHASNEQLRWLVHSFEQDPTPSVEKLNSLSAMTGMPMHNLVLWFKNRRARHKKTNAKETQGLTSDGKPRRRSYVKSGIYSKNKKKMSSGSVPFWSHSPGMTALLNAASPLTVGISGPLGMGVNGITAPGDQAATGGENLGTKRGATQLEEKALSDSLSKRARSNVINELIGTDNPCRSWDSKQCHLVCMEFFKTGNTCGNAEQEGAARRVSHAFFVSELHSGITLTSATQPLPLSISVIDKIMEAESAKGAKLNSGSKVLLREFLARIRSGEAASFLALRRDDEKEKGDRYCGKDSDVSSKG